MKYLAYIFLFFTLIASTPDRLKVRNNTGSVVSIPDIGRDIAASSTEEIQLNNHGLWAASEDLGPLIDSNTLDILLDNQVLSNDKAKEIIHSQRILEVVQTGGSSVSDVTRIEFDGPGLTLTDNTNGSATVSIDPSNTNIGICWSHCFAENGGASNEWLENTIGAIQSNGAPQPVPFDCTIKALTWSNRTAGADQDIEIHRSTITQGSGSSLIFDWRLINARTAVKSDLNININAGDKLAVFLEDLGNNANDPVVCIYMCSRTENTIDDIRQFSGNLSR